MIVNRRVLWPKRKRVTGRCKRRLGACRLKYRARYKRWFCRVLRPRRLQWSLLDIITENAEVGVCAAEDARFLASLLQGEVP